MLQASRRQVVESVARRFTDPVALLVHGLLVVSSMTQYAVLPVLPLLQHDFGVSGATLSWLLALPSLTMVVASMPSGWLCDRLGARQLTFAAAGVLTLSCVLQALPGLVVFVIGRFAFGLATTAIWTSGPAWLSESRKGSSGRVGAVVTSAAAGSIAGPLVAGTLADRFGLGVPFVIFAAASACLALPLALTGRRPVLPRQTTMRWTTVTRQVARSSELRAALAAMVAVGAVSGAIQLLVPLQLHRAGQSATGIGVAFSASGLVYVAASACAARARAATVTAAAAVAGCLVMGLTAAPAAFTDSSVVLVACLLTITLPRAQLNTVSYRLAATSETAHTGNLGLVVGLLNLVWAISMSLGPIAAAWLSSALGPGPAFLSTALWAGGVGIVLAGLLRHRRRHPLASTPASPR
ncbi:MAG: MFS transporter [Actinomycetota bacterium]|nr:MFS transporter [Actinomycetota bacterium]